MLKATVARVRGRAEIHPNADDTGRSHGVMIFTGGAVQVLQDFTGDRSRLLNIIQTLIVGEDQDSNDTINDASTADTGAAFGQDDGEFNIFTTDRQLAALQTAPRCSAIEREEVPYLLCQRSPSERSGQPGAATFHHHAAIRAGVSLYPIDARGLVAQAPLGDATKGSPGGLAMYTGASAMAAMSNFQRSQDTLWAFGRGYRRQGSARL